MSILGDGTNLPQHASWLSCRALRISSIHTWSGSLKRMVHIVCVDTRQPLTTQVPIYVVVFFIASNTDGQSRLMSSKSADSTSTTSCPVIPSKRLSPGLVTFHALSALSIVHVDFPSATEISFRSSSAVEFDPRSVSRRIRMNILAWHRPRNRASS